MPHFLDANGLGQVLLSLQASKSDAGVTGMPDSNIYRWITSSTNVSLPSGTYNITVIGGGGGARGLNTTTAGLAGGGAGAVMFFHGDLPAGTYICDIGIGGSGNGNNAASNGNQSQFSFNSAKTAYIRAGGGQAGLGTTSSPGGIGGTCSSATVPGNSTLIQINGAAGQAAGGTSTTAGINKGGQGGSTLFGTGGYGGTSGTPAGQAGVGYGAGGGGAYGNNSGGAGSSGAILIESVTSWKLFQGGIPDAPSDGKIYGRKNGEWVPISQNGNDYGNGTGWDYGYGYGTNTGGSYGYGYGTSTGGSYGYGYGTNTRGSY